MKKITFIIIAATIFSCKPKENTQQELNQLLDFIAYTEQVSDSVSLNFSDAIVSADSLATYQNYEELQNLFKQFKDSLQLLIFTNPSLVFLQSRYIEFFDEKLSYIQTELPDLLAILTKNDDDITYKELEKLKNFNFQAEGEANSLSSMLLSEKDSVIQLLSTQK